MFSTKPSRGQAERNRLNAFQVKYYRLHIPPISVDRSVYCRKTILQDQHGLKVTDFSDKAAGRPEQFDMNNIQHRNLVGDMAIQRIGNFKRDRELRHRKLELPPSPASPCCKVFISFTLTTQQFAQRDSALSNFACALHALCQVLLQIPTCSYNFD